MSSGGEPNDGNGDGATLAKVLQIVEKLDEKLTRVGQDIKDLKSDVGSRLGRLYEHSIRSRVEKQFGDTFCRHYVVNSIPSLVTLVFPALNHEEVTQLSKFVAEDILSRGIPDQIRPILHRHAESKLKEELEAKKKNLKKQPSKDHATNLIDRLKRYDDAADRVDHLIRCDGVGLMCLSHLLHGDALRTVYEIDCRGTVEVLTQENNQSPMVIISVGEVKSSAAGVTKAAKQLKILIIAIKHVVTKKYFQHPPAFICQAHIIQPESNTRSHFDGVQDSISFFYHYL